MANGPLAALDRAQAQQRQQALAATPGSILSFFKPKPVQPQQVDENRMRDRRQRLWQQFLESWRSVLNGGSSTSQYDFLMCLDQSPASRLCRPCFSRATHADRCVDSCTRQNEGVPPPMQHPPIPASASGPPAVWCVALLVMAAVDCSRRRERRGRVHSTSGWKEPSSSLTASLVILVRAYSNSWC